MPKVHEGKLDAANRRFAVVVARFNSLITGKLLAGALDCLRRHGCPEDQVEVAWVPGAFELPLVAKRLAATGRFDAVLCLGAIIRSETPHFDFVANETARGSARVGLETDVPVTFGVITTDDVAQAIDRAGVRSGNRGWDAAANAIEMADLLAGEPTASPEYAVVVDPDTLLPVDHPTSGLDLRVLVACRFGRARLIDNLGVVAG